MFRQINQLKQTWSAVLCASDSINIHSCFVLFTFCISTPILHVLFAHKGLLFFCFIIPVRDVSSRKDVSQFRNLVCSKFYDKWVSINDFSNRLLNEPSALNQGFKYIYWKVHHVRINVINRLRNIFFFDIWYPLCGRPALPVICRIPLHWICNLQGGVQCSWVTVRYR